MALITITDPDSIVRVETIISPGSAAYNGNISFGFWCYGASGLTLAQVRDAMESDLLAFYGTGTNGVRELLSTAADIIATRYSKPLDPVGEVPLEEARALAGTGSSGHLAPDLAAVISWRSDTKGPAFRGRSYIGGLSPDVSAGDGLIAAAKATIAQDAAVALIAALESSPPDLPMVALSRYHMVGGVLTERADPLAAPLIGAQVDVHFDTQRRRGAG